MEDFLERLKVFVWKLTYGTYYSVCYKLTFPMRRRLRILDSVATVRYIAEKRCSVSRYGDGEFQMVTHYINHGTSGTFHIDSFQCYDVALAARLLEVFTEPLQNHLICVPYAFKDSSVQKGYQRVFFEREWLFRRSYIAGTLCSGILLGDACFTRFYYGRRDIKDFKEYVGLLKTIWDNRKLLIVEGEQSRLGVGNDLFDNAAIGFGIISLAYLILIGITIKKAKWIQTKVLNIVIETLITNEEQQNKKENDLSATNTH